jgi:hypothetical protein
MPSSKPSAGLSPELVRRYQSAMSRFSATTSALRNGTPVTGMTPGATPPEDRTVRTTSTGFTTLTNELNARLEHLAFAERGGDQPPLVTYTTTSSPHGDVVSATPEFVAYLRRKVDGYGVEGPCRRAIPDRSAQGEGGDPPVSNRMDQFFKSP